MKRNLFKRTRIALVLASALLALVIAPTAAGDDNVVCAENVLNLGFYAYFEPVSYSASAEPESADFNLQLGYEADLLTALEAMHGTGIAFERSAIPLWDDIWLKSATPEYDIIGGGITILDSRRFNAAGEELIMFTSGHVTFRQSLMVRSEDAARLDSYAKLTSDVRVGALAGTTGEARFLQIAGFADESGTLIAGVRIETPQGSVVTDGSDDYFITAAGESPGLAGRARLSPPDETLPQVIYFGDELGEIELFEALAAGAVDALPRGEIGNRHAARAFGDDFVVTALDDQIEDGGFSLAKDDLDLAACLNEKIDWLTDERRIDIAQWLADPAVFMERARLWNERRDTEE